MKFDFEMWKTPTAEYRGMPFWALNGKLEKEDLKFQIECMKKMGFGGAFLHSRTGLVTEYMSSEWMEMLNYCVEVLQANGMEAWLYDEDRWPSGTCGGMVTQKEAFRAKSMVYDEIEAGAAYREPDRFLGLFAAKFDGENKHVKSYRKISSPEERKDGERVFVFYYLYMEPDDFYNGYTYVDTMNRAATERFITLTHEKYKAAMGEKFGKEIVGIFTDEPQRGPLLYWFSRKGEKKDVLIPYTYALFEEFEKRRGYKIEERLPVLWFGKDNEPFCKEMYDLVETLQELFLENFAKPYHEWCKANKLIVTGHILHEDNLVSQTTMCGSVMRYMEYMDYPGMDNLGSENYCYNVPALVSSVAKQLGKKYVLDEIYGCTGWNMRFADYKRIGDWQSFGGVTFRCPHLSWYTMKGESKRDCPASLLHQSAWWEDFSYIEDYFSRLQFLLKNGEDTTDVAILNPIESTWGLVDQYAHTGFFETENPIYKKIQDEYLVLYKELWLRGVSVDYIDEGLFAKYGKAENGVFVCGKKTYKTVILNGNYHLRGYTLTSLKKFMAQGGRVLVVGEYPVYLDGEKRDLSSELSEAVKLDFAPQKAAALLRDENVSSDSDKIIIVKRRYDDADVFLFLNSSKEKTETTLKIRTKKECVCLDCRTGVKRGISYKREGGFLLIEKTFEENEELVVLLQDEALPNSLLKTEKIPTPEMFTFALSEPNMLILDYCKFLIDGEIHGEDYILSVDKKVRARFGLAERNNEMIQPWYKNKYYKNYDKKYGVITLKYDFEIADVPKWMRLMCEREDRLKIELNGTRIFSEGKRTPLDNCFRVFDLPVEKLVKGKNRLEISFDFYESTDIEGAFLLGDFGVKEDKLVALPKTLTYGDLCEQGFPCFGGKIKLFANLPNGRYIAELNEMNCALVKINGQPIVFPPYRCEFSVENERVEIELTMTRNNTFATWFENGKRQNLKSQGIMGPIAIYSVKKKKENDQ